jgi:potassium-transporting ATPase potassium-binding subunit
VSVSGWFQVGLFLLVIVALVRPLGIYLYRVFESERPPLPRVFGPVERRVLRLCGVRPQAEQTWAQYTVALLLFSAVGLLVTYAIERLQHVLPLNPQHLGPVPADLAFNTAASFVTNTNWQSYSGEATMSYFTQMAGLAWHNFTSAAAGLGVALALARGLTRHPAAGGAKTLGNFWVDLVRATVYVLLPVSILVSLFFVASGVVQSLDPYRELITVEGARQTLALGPVASQEAIKMFGINGGGFFNANSAHPFENPTPLTNFVQLVLIFALPAALTYTYGAMAKDQRQGWALFGAMVTLFLAGVVVACAAEAGPNPALRGLAVDQSAGNLEGKETRFGVAGSALFATVTTDASCGAVNSMHDSFTPVGGMVPLVNMKLGEVVFGGVGAGLYGVLVFALLAVFIAGLMVGRTPEYLGKKVEAREMKLAVAFILIFPITVLVFAGWAAVAPYGIAALGNHGPHGLTEILYAYTSAAANNGSAFAGLSANTPFWNITLGLAMLIGRFGMMAPVLALAGSMVDKRVSPPGPGTFPTGGPLFAGLLVAVIVIVGALTFFPSLCLGPVIEHFIGLEGGVFP